MERTRLKPTDLEVHPVTADRWDDLLELVGERGAYSGCWCMWWRQTSAEFDRKSGKRNRGELKAIVDADREPGLLAYLDGRPVGWCSVAPREEFGRILRSPNLKPAKDQDGVWSIVCFYMDRRHRGRGIGTALLRAAVDHARARGARIVEAYPIDPLAGTVANPSAYTGVEKMFRDAGFTEVVRRSPKRPVMQRRVR